MLLTIALSLLLTAQATERSDAFENRAMSTFKQGKDFYQQGRFAKARDLFDQAAIDYGLAVKAETDPGRRITHQANADLMRRWYSASACMDHLDSNDVEQLRDLVGTNELASDIMNGYHEACVGFPQQAEFVKARIAELTTKKGASPFAGGCRSDAPGRGAPKNCALPPRDLGSQVYAFDLSSDCREFGYRAVIAVYDQEGACTRRVIGFETRRDSVVTSYRPPHVMDVILLHSGEGAVAKCYVDRHQAHPCVQ